MRYLKASTVGIVTAMLLGYLIGGLLGMLNLSALGIVAWIAISMGFGVFLELLD